MVNDNVSGYLVEMNNLRCALKSLQTRLDETLKENWELKKELSLEKKSYADLREDYSKIYEQRNEIINKYQNSEETIKKAIAYIKEMIIEEDNIDGLIKFYLDKRYN